MMSMKIALLEEELAASESRLHPKEPSNPDHSIHIGGEAGGTTSFGSPSWNRISRLVSTVQSNNAYMLSLLRESTTRQIATSSTTGLKAPIDRRTK